MPTFKNQDNKSFELLPEGNHPFCVVDFESGIQTGSGKTAGSPFWELKLEIEPMGASVWERLIDHPSTDWKIDCFMKSTGAAAELQPGQAFEFDADAANASGAAHINPIGLRGWCAIVHEAYTPKNAAPGSKPQKRARVSVFHTDKPKLPRKTLGQPAPDPQPQPVTPEPDPLSDGPF